MLHRLISVSQSLMAIFHAVENSKPNLQQHIPAIDAIRGLAVFGVFLYHFGGGLAEGHAWGGTKLLPAIEIGSRGVELFFVLSGFLITGILIDYKAKTGFFLNFYARRSLRIFPLYYGVLIVLLIGLPLFSIDNRLADKMRGDQAWLWFYGINLLMAYRGDWCAPGVNHFWSLAIEEQFYMVWPAVIYFCNRKQALWLCAALFLLAIISRFAWAASGGNDVTLYVFTLFRLDGLAAGSWLALMAREEGGFQRLVTYVRVIFVAVTLILIPMSLLQRRLLTLSDTLWCLESATFLVLCVTAARTSFLGRFGQSSFFHWLGKYSYGLYVYGSLLIPALAPYVTAPRLVERLGNAYLGQLAYFVIMSGATAAVAFASWHLFEKQLLRLKVYFTPRAT